MKFRKTTWLLLGLLPASMACAELPFTFEAGDPIRASELNANFQYLESLAGTGEGPLTRRRVNLRSTQFEDVVTVPDTATNGWVLRSYVTGCGDPILRIGDDDAFTMNIDAVLVVRAGETLRARCASSSTTGSAIGYFMFDEQ
jgi:hypothetical protein